MPAVKEIIGVIEKIAPAHLAEDWDNSGLQVGNPNDDVTKVFITVDPALDSAISAKAKGCQLIVTHHPLLFSGLKSIDVNDDKGRLVDFLLKNKITLYAAHTNLDKARDGFNRVLAEWLGLKDAKPLIPEKLAKLVTFVPKKYTTALLEALSQAGAGVMGNYQKASFRVSGTGTFEALPQAKPAIGEEGYNEVAEDRLELQFNPSDLKTIIEALKKAHPYEEVAFDVYNLENQAEIGIGAEGHLPKPMTMEKLLNKVKNDLNLEQVAFKGELEDKVKVVAVVAGSGSFYQTKADVLITGDIKHHAFRDSPLNLIDAPHFELESFALEKFSSKLASVINESYPEVKVIFEKGKPPRRFY